MDIESTTARENFRITYSSAMTAIQELRTKFGGSSLFGNEKDESFQGSLAAIYQTFEGAEFAAIAFDSNLADLPSNRGSQTASGLDHLKIIFARRLFNR